jgi:hypothetical protein
MTPLGRVSLLTENEMPVSVIVRFDSPWIETWTVSELADTEPGWRAMTLQSVGTGSSRTVLALAEGRKRPGPHSLLAISEAE